MASMPSTTYRLTACPEAQSTKAAGLYELHVLQQGMCHFHQLHRTLRDPRLAQTSTSDRTGGESQQSRKLFPQTRKALSTQLPLVGDSLPGESHGRPMNNLWSGTMTSSEDC